MGEKHANPRKVTSNWLDLFCITDSSYLPLCSTRLNKSETICYILGQEQLISKPVTWSGCGLAPEVRTLLQQPLQIEINLEYWTNLVLSHKVKIMQSFHYFIQFLELKHRVILRIVSKSTSQR